MVKAISVLGSTGSIGRQTLDVCREMGIKVAALTARSSIDLLEQQAREFRPKLVAVYDLEPAVELAKRLAGLDIEVAYGLDANRVCYRRSYLWNYDWSWLNICSLCFFMWNN